MMDSEAYEGSSIGLLDFHSESMLKLDGVQSGGVHQLMRVSPCITQPLLLSFWAV